VAFHGYDVNELSLVHLGKATSAFNVDELNAANRVKFRAPATRNQQNWQYIYLPDKDTAQAKFFVIVHFSLQQAEATAHVFNVKDMDKVAFVFKFTRALPPFALYHSKLLFISSQTAQRTPAFFDLNSGIPPGPLLPLLLVSFFLPLFGPQKTANVCICPNFVRLESQIKQTSPFIPFVGVLRVFTEVGVRL